MALGQAVTHRYKALQPERGAGAMSCGPVGSLRPRAQAEEQGAWPHPGDRQTFTRCPFYDQHCARPLDVEAGASPSLQTDRW